MVVSPAHSLPVNTNDRVAPEAQNGAPAPQGAAPVNATKKRRRHRRKRHAGSGASSAQAEVESAKAPAAPRSNKSHVEGETVSRWMDDATAAFSALTRAARALARSRGQEHQLESLELKLTITRNAAPGALAAAFLHELSARLDEARSADDAVAANRAYCLRCEGFVCDHAAPPSRSSIMIEYEPTGRPSWCEISTWLLSRGDARAASDGTSGIIVTIIDGDIVNKNRIEAFGGADPTVAVLVQIVAGPFRMPGGDDGALTLQLLRVRRGSRERLVFHPVGDARLLGVAGAALDPDLSRILANAHTAARTHPAAPARRGGETRHADRILQFARGAAARIARDLQHHFSVRGRRTLHARERATGGARPTANAFPEARSAQDEMIWMDVKTHTFVLLGKNGRVHFFSEDGRHVTSVRFGGAEIESRVEKQRWRRAAPSEIKLFREAIRRQHDPESNI